MFMMFTLSEVFRVSRNVKYVERCLTDAPADTKIIAGPWPVFSVESVMPTQRERAGHEMLADSHQPELS